MPEKARSISEVFNSRDSFESGLKAVITAVGLGADLFESFQNVPSYPTVWWLKLAAISAINAPLGLVLLYEAGRTLNLLDKERGVSRNIEEWKSMQRLLTDFGRIDQS